MKNYCTTRDSLDLFDPLFDEFFLSDNRKHTQMRTDIKEYKDHYEMKVDLPEVKKEEVSIKMENNYLTISVNKKEEKEEKDQRYITKERYTSNLSRSYYVGEGVDKNSIKAKLNDGVLTVEIQKLVKTNEDKYITIE